MATGSTASSGTDPQDPRKPAEAAEAPTAGEDGADEAAHDPARRAFFFQFGKQAASAVGQVAGLADVVGRTSSALAGELLGLDEPEASPGKSAFVRSGRSAEPVTSAAAPAAEHTYRSAYRLTDEGLVILDQRRIPEALDEVEAVRGSDVAYYLRLGVARGGPLMAQLAAYGLWLTAVERADQPAELRRVELRRTGQTLTDARPSSRLLEVAVERMQAATTSLGESSPGTDVAQALRSEADAIAAEVTASEATLARRLEAALPQPEGRPLTLLLHGGQGSLIAGQLGAGLTALSRMREAGRDLRVFLTEGRPFMDGARLASWELRQSGIEHQIVPDAGCAWLLARMTFDAVIVRGEWVAANGDTGALVGARGLAQLAAAANDGAGPRFVTLAPSAAHDAGAADGSAIPTELRPSRELAAFLSGTPIRASDALVPAADVIPAELVDTHVTDQEAIG
jgi:methylthioribose-1-phosphate isomerase